MEKWTKAGASWKKERLPEKFSLKNRQPLDRLIEAILVRNKGDDYEVVFTRDEEKQIARCAKFFSTGTRAHLCVQILRKMVTDYLVSTREGEKIYPYQHRVEGLRPRIAIAVIKLKK